MEQLIPTLVMLYLLYSVLSAFFKKAQQPPTEGEFGEAETLSPYSPEPGPEPVPMERRIVVPSDSEGELDVPVAEAPAVREAPASRLRPAQSVQLGEQTRARPFADEGEPTAAVEVVSTPQARSARIHEILSGPDSLRDAMLLMEVLGPPKALRRHPKKPY